MIYPRKEEKEYGTKAAVEGEYSSGERVVVIDDLVTTGESKFEVIEKLTRAGLVVNDIVVLIDRESGAKQALAESGLKLHAIFTLTELITHLKNNNLINNNQFNAVKTFIKYASTS
jgi:uridine monophosphate synthetase